MLAIDTSVWISYFDPDTPPSPDIEALDLALDENRAALPPVVLVEARSNPYLTQASARALDIIPLLEITAGYWERAARLRRTLLGKKLRALLPDTLIAQSCIDHGIPLLTRDRDFRHFATWSALQLA